jgi:hypothetical protein
VLAVAVLAQHLSLDLLPMTIVMTVVSLLAGR